MCYEVIQGEERGLDALSSRSQGMPMTFIPDVHSGHVGKPLSCLVQPMPLFLFPRWRSQNSTCLHLWLPFCMQPPLSLPIPNLEKNRDSHNTLTNIIP